MKCYKHLQPKTLLISKGFTDLSFVHVIQLTYFSGTMLTERFKLVAPINLPL